MALGSSTSEGAEQSMEGYKEAFTSERERDRMKEWERRREREQEREIDEAIDHSTHDHPAHRLPRSSHHVSVTMLFLKDYKKNAKAIPSHTSAPLWWCNLQWSNRAGVSIPVAQCGRFNQHPHQIQSVKCLASLPQLGNRSGTEKATQPIQLPTAAFSDGSFESMILLSGLLGHTFLQSRSKICSDRLLSVHHFSSPSLPFTLTF